MKKLKYDIIATYFPEDDTTVQLLSFYDKKDSNIINITADYYRVFKKIFPKLDLPYIIKVISVQKGTKQIGLKSKGNPYKILKDDWGNTVLLRLNDVSPAQTISEEEYDTYYQI